MEHRLEKVARVRGIDFINDSKATNVNSCWYALQSMKTKTVLILGGKDKGNDYNEIADLVREKCSGLIFMGLHNEKLHDFFDGFGLPIVDVQSIEKMQSMQPTRWLRKVKPSCLAPAAQVSTCSKVTRTEATNLKKYVREL